MNNFRSVRVIITRTAYGKGKMNVHIINQKFN
jgi:hypothetical protein